MEQEGGSSDGFKKLCSDIGITLLSTAPSDFDRNHLICSTGDGRVMYPSAPSLSTTVGIKRTVVTKDNTLYYHVDDSVHASGPPFLLGAFDGACSEWTVWSGIVVRRINVRDDADFRLRMANDNEEEEAGKGRVVESFCWATHPKHHIKVIKVWRRIADWDAYAIFLHAMGHVLGLRHEDCFSTTCTRVTTASQTLLESTTGPLVKNAQSIMSYEYLCQFKKKDKAGEEGRNDNVEEDVSGPKLSPGDKVWAKVVYGK